MESQLSRTQAYWVLNGLPAVGPVSLNRLLDAFGGDPCQVLAAKRSQLEQVKGLQRRAVDTLLEWERFFDLEKESRQAERCGVDFISREHGDYPELLRQISDPPIGLYRKGEYDFRKPMVAIIGTRHCTLYGKSVAEAFGRDLAERGFGVVSGMARGIDTHAHRGALSAAGGSTVCVFGCGLDIVYPPENVDIFRECQKNGAVLSEFPFGRRADRQTFPMRNRVVSGMSHAVIVVESDEAGGSMITAKFAGEQGRLVCAVPGRIDQKSSRGCHRLIQDGALLMGSVEDLLAELDHLALAPELELETDEEESVANEVFDGDERKVIEGMAGGEASSLEEVAQRSGMEVSQAASVLMMLELKGAVAKRLDGRYELAVTFGARR